MEKITLTSTTDVHTQYLNIIKYLVEKQVSKEMPELEDELITIEIDKQYKKILHEYFGIPKPFSHRD